MISSQASSPTRPRIVHVVNNLGVGGVEAMCLGVIHYFSQWADNSILILNTKDDPFRPDFQALNLPIINLSYNPGKQLQLIQKSYAYCHEHKIDALVCWSFGNHAFISLGARLAGVSHMITSVQNAPPDSEVQKLKWQTLAWIGFLGGSRLVACSHYVRDCLVDTLNLPDSQVFVISNSCNVLEINQRAKATSVDKPDKPIIGMVARFNKIKDQKTLIESMPLVLTKYPTAELWLIGDGEQQDFLEQLTLHLNLTQNVKFLGSCHNIPELLGQMDVFAFSTTPAEGFGIVLAEALAASVPIVASQVGPCSEVLQQGKWGSLVEPANPHAFGKAIIEILKGNFSLPDLHNVYTAYDTEIASQKYWNLLFRKPLNIHS